MPHRPLSILLAAVLLAGCGGSSAGTAGPPPEPAPSAKPADFPAAHGMTLADLRGSMPEGPILAPSVQVLRKGANRVGFALFDTARKQLSGAPVALYTSAVDGSGLRGPFIARAESLVVKPQFESRTTASDPNAARSVYVSDVPFKHNGKFALIAVAKLDGRLVTTSLFGMTVGGKDGPPDVGQKAIRITTPTVASVAGDAAKIDTRDPPATDLQQVNFADVLGRKPIVLVFATPRLCQSRVCGPVVDIAEQAKAQVGDRVDFIHVEIYRDNDVSKGFLSQVARYRLPTEPWTFVIDRKGLITDRFEGAYSAGELERAVAKVS
jgi:hypothetical protein